MITNFTKLYLLFLIITASGFSQSVFERWHTTDKLIRDRKIDEDAAIDSIIMYVKLGKQEFKTHNIPGTKRSDS